MRAPASGPRAPRRRRGTGTDAITAASTWAAVTPRMAASGASSSRWAKTGLGERLEVLRHDAAAAVGQRVRQAARVSAITPRGLTPTRTCGWSRVAAASRTAYA